MDGGWLRVEGGGGWLRAVEGGGDAVLHAWVVMCGGGREEVDEESCMDIVGTGVKDEGKITEDEDSEKGGDGGEEGEDVGERSGEEEG